MYFLIFFLIYFFFFSKYFVIILSKRISDISFDILIDIYFNNLFFKKF